MDPRDDERWMAEALQLAARAGDDGDVPVGAVLIDAEGALVASGRNRRNSSGDPTAHAEIEALRGAATALGRWRLDDLTMYVSLEPCPMCAGALVNARLGRLVYGARNHDAGAIDTLFVLGRDPRLNHRFAVTGGVLAEQASALLVDFFGARRGQKDDGRGR